jgi:hypothetical protein
MYYTNQRHMLRRFNDPINISYSFSIPCMKDREDVLRVLSSYDTNHYDSTKECRMDYRYKNFKRSINTE